MFPIRGADIRGGERILGRDQAQGEAGFGAGIPGVFAAATGTEVAPDIDQLVAGSTNRTDFEILQRVVRETASSIAAPCLQPCSPCSPYTGPNRVVHEPGSRSRSTSEPENFAMFNSSVLRNDKLKKFSIRQNAPL